MALQSPQSPASASSALPSRYIGWLACAALAAAALAAYHNCFSVPFLYDDATAIVSNSTLRQLWPLWLPLSPPVDVTTEGRPILNLSFALNYVTTGYDLRALHATNLAIHLSAALCLFGIVRRTLGKTPLRERFGKAHDWLALTVAALWTLHPLQTQSVTYLVQRAEALMSLFYLLTLYCFIRAVESPRSTRWYCAAVAACALGMGSKEVMVSAPLIVLLYDRAFVAGTFREAWRSRRAFYCALAATWIVLILAVASTGGVRGGSAGFGSGMPWWVYFLTQLKAIVNYLRLALWPDPLIFDYGIVVVRSPGEVMVHGLFLAALGLGAAWCVWRRPALGFLGAAFFALLAPSSSVVPVVTETIAEHRMYLPLAPLAALVATGAYRWAGPRSIPTLLAAAVLLGIATEKRNRDYQTSVSLWTDTIRKRPLNPRAHNHLALAYSREGRLDDSLAAYREALRLKPDDPESHYNVATALIALRRPNDAFPHFEEALRLRPTHSEAHSNYGLALMQSGQIAKAIGRFEESLRHNPREATTHNNLGIALAQTGRLPEALPHFEEAVKLAPAYAEAHNNRGFALKQSGDAAASIVHFERAVALDPNYTEARNNLGLTLAQVGRRAEAVPHLEAVALLEPAYADGHYHLGRVLVELGRNAEAIRKLQEALRVQPGHPQAGALLGKLRDGNRPAAEHDSSTPTPQRRVTP